MTDSTSTTSCRFCGKPLQEIRVRIGDRETFGGWEPCGCAAARADRERRAVEEMLEEERQREERRRKSLLRAGIPERFLGADHELAPQLLERAKGGTGAYIVGNVGTGKTHLACSVAKLAIEGGMSAKVDSTVGFLARVRSTFGTDESEDEVVARYCRVDLLVLDDLGKEAPTDWSLMQLFRIIDARYGSMRPVIVTTQFQRSDLARRLAKNDPETARAIVSRLAETCEKVELGGPDRRLG